MSLYVPLPGLLLVPKLQAMKICNNSAKPVRIPLKENQSSGN